MSKTYVKPDLEVTDYQMSNAVIAACEELTKTKQVVMNCLIGGQELAMVDNMYFGNYNGTDYVVWYDQTTTKEGDNVDRNKCQDEILGVLNGRVTVNPNTGGSDLCENAHIAVVYTADDGSYYNGGSY